MNTKKVEKLIDKITCPIWNCGRDTKKYSLDKLLRPLYNQKGGKTVVIRLAVKRSRSYISNILNIRGIMYA